MTIPFGVLARLVLIAAVCLACAPQEPKLAGGVRAQPLEVAAVSLPDVANGGTPLQMKASSGELLVVYFGYTSCPDVCPTTMSEIGQALRNLPEDLRLRVSVAMATVDPDRDTDERLTGYLAHFFEHGHALRQPDPVALAEAADAFEVRWEAEDHAPGEPYAVAHTAVTYVVDDTGTVLDEWPFGLDYELMASDLTTLLRKYDR